MESCALDWLSLRSVAHGRDAHATRLAPPQAPLTRRAASAGLVLMPTETKLETIVVTLLTRFFVQNGRVPPADETLMRVATQLRALIDEHGLPPPLAPGERRTAQAASALGGVSEAEAAVRVGRVLSGVADDPLLNDAVRQLLKACFYPELSECRDSFREVTGDGVCRRQQLARTRGRISGSHCVDCPHWIALTPEQHGAMLAREWRGAPNKPAETCAAEFFAQRAIFLPEDFRALRGWLHAAARA